MNIYIYTYICISKDISTDILGWGAESAERSWLELGIDSSNLIIQSGWHFSCLMQLLRGKLGHEFDV